MSLEPPTTPPNLEAALAFFPPAYFVAVNRCENDRGIYFLIRRKQNDGEFTIIGDTLPTWQEAFYSVWSKL